MKGIVLGSTGLVGSALVKQLANDDEFSEVTLVGRRPMENQISPKFDDLVIDFDDPNSYQGKISGDVLFSAFGTTIKKAGSQERQYQIDVDYQFNIAEEAAKAGVKSYVLISALGADAKSRIFYNRIKGELEDKVRKLPFESITILRPSVLAGDRKEERTGESIGIWVGKNIMPLIPIIRRYRAISDEKVAKAMIISAKEHVPFQLLLNHQIHELIKHERS